MSFGQGPCRATGYPHLPDRYLEDGLLSLGGYRLSSASQTATITPKGSRRSRFGGAIVYPRSRSLARWFRRRYKQRVRGCTALSDLPYVEGDSHDSPDEVSHVGRNDQSVDHHRRCARWASFA